jgi:hypothetical protein
MEPWQLDIAMYLARHFWAVAGGLCWGAFWWGRATWRLWTRTRYLGEALERLGRVNSSRENALAERITKRLLDAFFRAPKPTLQSLANDTQTPFSLKPSTGFFPKQGG